MSVLTAISKNQETQAAVQEIQSRFADFDAKVIVYFASSGYDFSKLAPAMRDAFPKKCVFGCSTSGEIISGAMTKNSIVAMALGKDLIDDAWVQVVTQVSTEDHVKKAFQEFETHYHTPALELDPEKYVGIVLCDGLSQAEEKLMDLLGNETNVTFIGGSAGDDLKFSATYVCADGKCYQDAAVLVLMKAKGKFDFVKTQSFYSKGKVLTATKVDEAKRMVLEFNHEPAVKAYAAAIGEEKNLEQYFMRHPLGLMIDGEPYVRSPQQIQDQSIVFYCNVKENMNMALLESTDILADTARSLREMEQKNGPIQAIINFNCILRTLQLENEGLTEQYGQLFAETPTIGFSTYGEAYIGHINQTATMLLFF